MLVASQWLLALVLIVVSEVWADNGESMLHFDPFKRPAILSKPAAPGKNPNQDTREPWSPVLRATMLAGDFSMVNLNGVIISLGEEVDGYRLVEVGEQTAVFAKNGKRHVLSME